MDLVFSPFYRILANHNLITIFLKPFAVLSGVLKQLGFVMFFLSQEEQSHKDSCALKRENKWWYQSDMSMQLTECLASSLSIMIVDKIHKSIIYWTDCVRSTAKVLSFKEFIHVCYCVCYWHLRQNNSTLNYSMLQVLSSSSKIWHVYCWI